MNAAPFFAVPQPLPLGLSTLAASGAHVLSRPMGRLTLTTAVPVLTGAVSASPTVYYTPAEGNVIPLPISTTAWGLYTFAELSNVLANAATGNAGPAAGAASKNYDLFVWNNAGTVTLTRGAAWNSATVRSSTTENDLTRTNGVLGNLNAITNGPGVGLGVYVGTVRTDSGGATVTWNPGGQDTSGALNVWNTYNRTQQEADYSDTTQASWTYSSATIRQANANAAAKIDFVRGLNEDAIDARYSTRCDHAAAAGAASTICVGLDSTSAFPNSPARVLGYAQTTLATAGFKATVHSGWSGLPGLGFHTITAIEAGDATNLTTFYGATYQKLSVALRA